MLLVKKIPKTYLPLKTRYKHSPSDILTNQSEQKQEGTTYGWVHSVVSVPATVFRLKEINPRVHVIDDKQRLNQY